MSDGQGRHIFTDLYRLGNGTLNAIRYQDEITGPSVRPHTDTVGHGFRLVQHNAQPHGVRVWRLEDEGIYTTDWPLRSTKSNRAPHPRALPHHFFTFAVGMSLNSALCRLIIFISNQHINRSIQLDIQHDFLTSACVFQK